MIATTRSALPPCTKIGCTHSIVPCSFFGLCIIHRRRLVHSPITAAFLAPYRNTLSLLTRTPVSYRIALSRSMASLLECIDIYTHNDTRSRAGEKEVRYLATGEIGDSDTGCERLCLNSGRFDRRGSMHA
jgi:hypothetical protein